MLYVRHKRDGKALAHEWTWGFLAAVLDAAEANGVRQQLREEGRATLAIATIVIVRETGEQFRFEAGDEIELWRA